MDLQLGKFEVFTTENGGHDPDFYVERILNRMISVSDTAPEPIRAQANAFREKMRLVLRDGMRRAILSDRETLAVELERHGLKEAAALVRTKGL